MSGDAGPTMPDPALNRDHAAAAQALAVQDRSDKWRPLEGTVPVTFMKHRNGMCRWPLGDPRDFDSFRFCGCACPGERIYCQAHEALAFPGIKSGKTVFARRSKTVLAPKSV